MDAQEGVGNILLQVEIFVERIFLEELMARCQRAFAICAELNHQLSGGDQDNGQRTVNCPLVFELLSAFVLQAGLASKILWPPNQGCKRARLRGEHLRTALGIQQGHVLENRSLRNHYEHFDERLDDWSQLSRDRRLADRIIGPPWTVSGLEEHEIIRHYDPEARVLTFRGERYCIQDLADALGDVQFKVEERLHIIDPWRS